MKKLTENQIFEQAMDIILHLRLEATVAQEKCKENHKKFSMDTSLCKNLKFHRKDIFNKIYDLEWGTELGEDGLTKDRKLKTVKDAVNLIGTVSSFIVNRS